MDGQMTQGGLPLLRPARFTLDDGKSYHRGWTNGETWNGWARPVFDHVQARAVVRSLARSGNDIRWDPDDGHGSSIVYTFVDGDSREECRFVPFSGDMPTEDPDTRLIALVWQIGSGWTWLEEGS